MIERYYKEVFLDKGYLLDNYNSKNLIIEKINDPRLTADMRRTRSGSTQMFRRDYGDRQFTSNENADVTLKNENQSYYAEFIEGEWYWVNGCYQCANDKRDWMGYSTCVVHDVCAHCAIPRAELKEAPWGRKEGWVCKPCAQIEHDEEKAKALAWFDESEFDEDNYRYLNAPKCPYCDHELTDPPEYWGESKDIKCPRCDSTYAVEAEVSYQYHTTRTTQK